MAVRTKAKCGTQTIDLFPSALCPSGAAVAQFGDTLMAALPYLLPSALCYIKRVYVSTFLETPGTRLISTV